MPPSETAAVGGSILAYVCEHIRMLGRVGSDASIAQLRIDDTGIDSLELTELIMAVEDTFAITIDDQLLTGEMTISDLCVSIQQDSQSNSQ